MRESQRAQLRKVRAQKSRVSLTQEKHFGALHLRSSVTATVQSSLFILPCEYCLIHCNKNAQKRHRQNTVFTAYVRKMTIDKPKAAFVHDFYSARDRTTRYVPVQHPCAVRSGNVQSSYDVHTGVNAYSPHNRHCASAAAQYARTMPTCAAVKKTDQYGILLP